MVDINEIGKKIETKKFKKEAYRPWDLDPSPAASNEKPPISPVPGSGEADRSGGGVNKQSNNEKNKLTPDSGGGIDYTSEPPSSKIDTNAPEIYADPPVADKKEGGVDYNRSVPRIQVISNSIEQELVALRGAQLRIFEMVYGYQDSSGRPETGPIITEWITNSLGIVNNTRKSATTRLVKKGLLTIKSSKMGRGGFVNLSIPKKVFESYSKVKNFSVGCAFLNHSVGGEVDSKNKAPGAPENWLKIRTNHIQDTLAAYGEIFGKAQLRSIYKKSKGALSVKQVQQSIDRFVAGIKENPDSPVYSRGTKVAALLDALNNGDEFFDPIMKDMENTKKAAHKSKEDLDLHDKLLEKEFDSYFSGLTIEKKMDLIPRSVKNNGICEKAIKTKNNKLFDSIAKKEIKRHFLNELWPKKWESIQKSMN